MPLQKHTGKITHKSIKWNTLCVNRKAGNSNTATIAAPQNNKNKKHKKHFRHDWRIRRWDAAKQRQWQPAASARPIQTDAPAKKELCETSSALTNNVIIIYGRCVPQLSSTTHYIWIYVYLSAAGIQHYPTHAHLIHTVKIHSGRSVFASKLRFYAVFSPPLA